MRRNGVQLLFPLHREGSKRPRLMDFGANRDNPDSASQIPARPNYRIHAALATLIDRLDGPAVSKTDVIRWGCPVPSFGDLSSARIATVGLNPSNREFVDGLGNELEGPSRRFHTLKSLGIASWADRTLVTSG